MTKGMIESIAADLYRLGLTKREVEVCSHLYDLPDNATLASRLSSDTKPVTIHAIHFHLRQIYRKLGVESRRFLFLRLEALIKENRLGPQILEAGVRHAKG